MVDRYEIAKYYLKCEIGRGIELWNEDAQFSKEFDDWVESIPKTLALRIALFLSGPLYRKNSLQGYLARNGLSWTIAKLDIQRLKMPIINPEVNPYLEQCNWMLKELCDFLMVNRQLLDGDLAEFKDHGGRMYHERLICAEVEGAEIQIIDGGHRAVVLGLKGRDRIEAYVSSS